jgi:DNA-binding winged helix-turn-helix (wHTH) protein/TolB-like protein
VLPGRVLRLRMGVIPGVAPVIDSRLQRAQHDNGGSLIESSKFRFGVFVFDPVTLELLKGDRPVRLRPQALKLLRLLVTRPRQLISREEIHKELWGADVFVDFEQGVNHSVKQLRAALGDVAEAPRYIETLPRRGYRFIAPVESFSENDVAAAVTPGRDAPARSMVRFPGVRAWLVLTLSVAATILMIFAASGARRSAPPPSATSTLAVLPFSLAGVPDDGKYLGISLADAVISRLAMSNVIRVRPTDTVVKYDARATDFEAVGRTLQADYVLAGTLQREGDTHRAALQLVHVPTARTIWRGAVETAASDLIGLENAISARVVSALTTKPITAGGRGRTDNPAAYQAYLQGRFYLARATSEETLAAVAAFERALATDSKYPLALAGLAKACAQMSIRFAADADVPAWRACAERHARRALELEGTLAEAHEALAAVARYTEFDWDRTIEQSLEALRLNPGLDLPHYYLAAALQHIGRLDMVEAEVAAGLEANPLNLAEVFRLRGMTALWAGRFPDARTQFERLRELSSKPVSYTPLAQALYYAGDIAQAEAMLAGLRESAQSEQRAASLLASFLAARGERSRALTLVSQVLSRDYRDHHVAYSLGATYAGLDQPGEAFRWLREAVTSGFACSPWYEADPLLSPLRTHKDFRPFMAEVKSAADRIAAGSFRELAPR